MARRYVRPTGVRNKSRATTKAFTTSSPAMFDRKIWIDSARDNRHDENGGTNDGRT